MVVQGVFSEFLHSPSGQSVFESKATLKDSWDIRILVPGKN